MFHPQALLLQVVSRILELSMLVIYMQLYLDDRKFFPELYTSPQTEDQTYLQRELDSKLQILQLSAN